MPTITVTTRARDEAQDACGRVYFPHRLTVLDPQSFGMSLSAIDLGRVRAGVLAYRGEVLLETAELETGYEVNVPLDGPLRTWTGHADVCATPQLAAVYRPDGRTTMRGWAGGGRLFGLRIERGVLEDTLADLIDRPVRAAAPLGQVVLVPLGRVVVEPHKRPVTDVLGDVRRFAAHPGDVAAQQLPVTLNVDRRQRRQPDQRGDLGVGLLLPGGRPHQFRAGVLGELQQLGAVLGVEDQRVRLAVAHALRLEPRTVDAALAAQTVQNTVDIDEDQRSHRAPPAGASTCTLGT